MSIYLAPSPACNAQKVTVGLTPVPLGSNAIICQELSLMADSDNLGNIYIGAQGIVSATRGFKLTSNQGLSGIRVNSPNVIWAVASIADQVLWVFWTEPLGAQ